MKKNKIIVAGIGPGSPEDITPAVLQAVQASDVIVGYKYYFRFIKDYVRPDALCIDSGMKAERQRAEEAFRYALEGKTVCVISSGDAGIYGMSPLIYEMMREKGITDQVEVEVLPGISAFQKAAALLGCPIGHDLCIISLSDLMTPWLRIEKRIEAAAAGDFITAIYNPKSQGRYWQIYRLLEIFAQHRSPDTPIGYVRQAGREEQVVKLTTLAEFDPEELDMFTVVIIGNTQSYSFDGHFITPRGYYDEGTLDKDAKIGQAIMIESFRTINSELANPNIPLDHKWALIHSIHTTADFEMEKILYSDPGAVSSIYQAMLDGKFDTIITDVTMVASGIRKGMLERLGLQVKCYLNDPRTKELADLRASRARRQGSVSPSRSIPMRSSPWVMPPPPSSSSATSSVAVRPSLRVWSSRPSALCRYASRSIWRRSSRTSPRSSSKAARAVATSLPRWSTPSSRWTMPRPCALAVTSKSSRTHPIHVCGCTEHSVQPHSLYLYYFASHPIRRQALPFTGNSSHLVVLFLRPRT